MPRQILLADDSATIARMVQITFAHEDYAVTTVKTGDEALARARAARPDVVLVDAGLSGQGGRSGYDLCADLRAGGLRDVPILLLTNNFVPYDDARGQRAGADGFVVKPFETQALIDRVAQVLSGQRPAAAAAPVQTSRPPMTPAAVVPVAAAVRPSPVISGPAAPTVQMAAPVLPTPARAPVAAPPPAVPVAPIQPVAPVTPVATRQPIATPTTPQPVVRSAVPPVQIQPPLAADAGPKPRATILGLPTVGENGLPVVAPAAPVQPIQPVQVAPVQPVRPVQPVVAPAPIAPPPVVVPPERQAPTREMAAPVVPPQPAAPAVPVPVRNEPSRSIRAEAPTGTQPRIDAARSAKANDYAVETATFPGPVGRPGEATAPAAAAPRKATIPTNAPRMPRPSLVPNAPSAETLRQIVKSVVSAADARMGQALGSHPEYEAVARLSREVIEQIAWEVVPELAEVLIKENMDRLVRERARG